jgi:RES domain-containing protein
MILWRLTKRPHADLSGRGGELFDGRWHTRGRPVVYCANTAALSVLEVRVHLDLALGLFPEDYVLMKANAPEDIDVHVLRGEELPQGWRESEELCRPLGDAWLKDAPTALLQAPSAIIDVEANVLLNPRHPEAARVRIEQILPFRWDRRLLEPRPLRS